MGWRTKVCGTLVLLAIGIGIGAYVFTPGKTLEQKIHNAIPGIKRTVEVSKKIAVPTIKAAKDAYDSIQNNLKQNHNYQSKQAQSSSQNKSASTVKPKEPTAKSHYQQYIETTETNDIQSPPKLNLEEIAFNTNQPNEWGLIFRRGEVKKHPDSSWTYKYHCFTVFQGYEDSDPMSDFGVIPETAYVSGNDLIIRGWNNLNGPKSRRTIIDVEHGSLNGYSISIDNIPWISVNYPKPEESNIPNYPNLNKKTSHEDIQRTPSEPSHHPQPHQNNEEKPTFDDNWNWDDREYWATHIFWNKNFGVKMGTLGARRYETSPSVFGRYLIIPVSFRALNENGASTDAFYDWYLSTGGRMIRQDAFWGKKLYKDLNGVSGSDVIGFGSTRDAIARELCFCIAEEQGGANAGKLTGRLDNGSVWLVCGPESLQVGNAETLMRLAEKARLN